MTNQVCTYDFTLSVEKFPDLNILQKNLTEWCKKWVFQREVSESGFNHWQGRVSLIKKTRQCELVKKTKNVFPGIHWSITSSCTHDGSSFNYVMKADTRADGPWSDEVYQEPPPLTRQLRNFMQHEHFPWQLKVKEMVQELDDRSIKLIVDILGDSGKSIFAEYLEYNNIAYEIPPFRAMEDIMQCVMSSKTHPCYLIDMPRAMKKDKLSEFYAGLEALKNGVCYDKRYKFKKRRMDRPQVVVFTNRDPCWSYMSLDRWEIYDMNSAKELVKRNSLGIS